MTDLMERPSFQNPPPSAGPATPPAPPAPPVYPTPTPGAPSGRSPRGKRAAALAAAVALALGSGTAGGALAYHYWDQPAAPAAAATATQATNASTVDATLSGVVKTVSPSVVTIFVPVQGGTAEGSGVILDADGQILTNNHVVEGATGTAKVQLADGSTASARILRTDPSHDLALIQVEGVNGLTPATLGDSGTVQVGDTVLAFGSPLGLTGTVTAGIVSALDRDASDLDLSGLIQTDAPINSGNSGGPLVDAAGRVIAINVASASTSQGGGSIGIGFAIPIDTAIQTILQ
jgi:putative serine protease PepD